MDTTQQFVLNNDELIDASRTIKTNFYTTIVYLHLFKNTPKNGGYIQMPLFITNGEENVQYITPSFSSKKYKCKNLYIFKASHNIAVGESYDGEMVIELEPISGSSDKLFACFLLKNKRFSNNEASSLDNIIKMSNKPPSTYTAIDFTLESYIRKDQKKIIYSNLNDTVIVYTTPISIRETDFASFTTIPSSLFALYPSDSLYHILYDTSNIEGFKEGIDKVMTCTPINMSDPSAPSKGKNTATYLMDNKMSKQERQLGLVYSMIMFIVTLFAAYFGAPPIYKMLIIDQNKTSEHLILSSFILLFLLFVFGFVLLINGAIYDGTESMFGMISLLLIILSVVSIINKRASDEDYRTPSGAGSIPVNMNFSDFYFGDAMADFLLKLSNNTLGKYFFRNSENLGICIYWLILLIILAIPCAVIGAKKDKAANKKEKAKKGYRKNLIGLIMGFGSVYGMIALIFIFNSLYPAS